MAGLVDAAGAEITGIPLAPSVAFGALPPSPRRGMIVVITDANSNAWGDVIASGGGTDVVLAWYNGTAWTVIGK